MSQPFLFFEEIIFGIAILWAISTAITPPLAKAAPVAKILKESQAGREINLKQFGRFRQASRNSEWRR